MIIFLKKDIEGIKSLLEKVPSRHNPDQYFEYVKSVVDNEDTLLLVNINKVNVIDSFLFAEMVINMGRKDTFVDLAYVNPKAKGVAKELMSVLTKWALLKGSRHITALVEPKRALAFGKRFGFITESIYLSKEVSNG